MSFYVVLNGFTGAINKIALKNTRVIVSKFKITIDNVTGLFSSLFWGVRPIGMARSDTRIPPPGPAPGEPHEGAERGHGD